MLLPSLYPEFYATLDEVQSVEAAAGGAFGRPRLAWQALLAWHLRQREKIRAQALAAELEPDLRAAAQVDAGYQPWLARLLLVRAEQPWMDGDAAGLQRFADEALTLFTQANDAAGEGDTHWLLAHLAWQRTGCHDAALSATAAAYRRAGDARRCQLLALRRRYSDSFYQPAPAPDPAADRDRADKLAMQHPAVRAWELALEGSRHSHDGQFSAALVPTMQAVEAALA